MADDYDEGDSMSLCIDDSDGLLLGAEGQPGRGKQEKLVDLNFFNQFTDDFDESDVRGQPPLPGHR